MYSVTPKSQKDLIVLQEIYETEKFDFWSTMKALDRPTNIMASPELKELLVSTLEAHKLEYEVLIDNVET